MGVPKGIRWTNRSALALAPDADPVAVIREAAQSLLLKAREHGWEGPPFNPLKIVEMLGATTTANANIADARLRMSPYGPVVEYNPQRAGGRGHPEFGRERDADAPSTSPGVNRSAKAFHASLCDDVEAEMARQGFASQAALARGKSDLGQKLRGEDMIRRPDIAIDGGVAVIDGQPLPLVKIHMDRTIDSGAHGSVFEATETELERTVAVKIWYRQGEHVRAGAIGEVRKLAAVQHPLFASVYRLEIAFDAPYAVMEYLPGPSVKQWLRTEASARVGDGKLIDYLRTNQSSLRQCCRFWFLYSAGLRHLYSQGLLHGDPHLGNVIVYDDIIGTLDYLIARPELRRGGLSSLKILDLGTSLFRADPAQIRVREARVILESAGKLFPDFPPAQLMTIDFPLEPAVMLAVLDKYAEYIFELSSVPGMTETDFDFLEHGLPQLLGWCPFFNYTAVASHLTTLFEPQDAGGMITSTLMMLLGRGEPEEDYSTRLARLEGLSIAQKIEQLESASRTLRTPDWQDR